MSYLLIVIFIAFSAFFSASELSYTLVNENRLKNKAENGNNIVAKFAYYIYKNYDKALTTILLGNNLVNIASSSVATVIIIEILGENFAWASTLIMTVVILIFGEIFPKILANQFFNTFVIIAAVPLRILMTVLTPFVWLILSFVKLVSKLWEGLLPKGPSVTEDDLESIIDTAEDEGVLDEEQSELFQSALDFNDVLAYEIITPRVDMIAIDIEDDYDKIIETIKNSPCSRIPVYSDTPDNIIGILHLNSVFKELVDEQKINIQELLMPAVFVHKTMQISEVFTIMKSKKSHIVIVTDEYGGTMGILTMEDVLEQLVGDIWDESDIIEDEVKEVSDDFYEVDGDMRIYDFFDEMDIDDKDFDDDNATLGGWAIQMLGDYPNEGDKFEYKNLEITVKEMDNLRVVKLSVKVNEPVEEEEELI